MFVVIVQKLNQLSVLVYCNSEIFVTANVNAAERKFRWVVWAANRVREFFVHTSSHVFCLV